MVKFIFKLLILIIVVLGAVLLVRDDPGVVLMRYHDYEVETSLAFALVVLVVMMILIYYCIRLLRGLLRIPHSMRNQSQNRRFGKARRQLNEGLIDLAEGRFEQAENNLVRLVDFSESPLVHYLAAARAAQLQGKYDARDKYLKDAHEARPDAELAIGVTQAELQLAHQQTEQALATLMHLHSIAPRHDYVTRLLARAHFELEDWRALVDILPDVRRKKLVKEPQLLEMEIAGYCGLLELATSNQQSFDDAWNKVPQTLWADGRMIRLYLNLLAKHHWQNRNAEQLVLKSLESNGMIA